MDRRVTLLLFLSLLFSGAKASVVSLSLKESEQRFSEHNLEVIAERYNIDIIPFGYHFQIVFRETLLGLFQGEGDNRGFRPREKKR